MDTKPKNRVQIALVMLCLFLLPGLAAMSPTIPDSSDCTAYGVAYTPYDDNCNFYIILDNGVLIQPEEVLEILTPDGATRVKVGYEVIDSINSPCGLGLLVHLTCLQIIQDSIGCSARFTYEMIRCDSSAGDTRCGDYSYQFYNHSAGDVIASRWDFGDGSGSSAVDPEHTYSEPGMYEVCLSILTSDSCLSQNCTTIYVEDIRCNALFSYSGVWCTEPDSWCIEKNTYQFFNYSSGNNFTSHWDFGDGTSSDEFEPMHSYSEPGVYEVCLNILAQDSCSSQYCMTIYIEDTRCNASFTYGEVYCILEGDVYCGENTYQFTNYSLGLMPSYHWDFGDGTSSNEFEPMHSFDGPGVYEVCLNILTQDSCSSQYCVTIIVGDTTECRAMFEYYFPPVDCGDSLGDCINSFEYVQFIDMSRGNITEWAWDFGDGTTSNEQNPGHQFPGQGVYSVCLSISSPDNCWDMYCMEVVISETSDCHAYFDYCNYSTGDSTLSDNLLLVGFRNLSEGYADYFWWDFGDGSYSSEENPVHRYEYSGFYEVCLNISSVSGCYDTYCTTINVGPADCSVDFTYEIIFPNCIGFEPAYMFTPSLEEPYWYIMWDLGDGNYSYDETAVHVYERVGEYNVCAEVYYQNNCYARLCKTILVTQNEQDSIWYDKCDPVGLPGGSVDTQLSILKAYPNPANDQLNLVINSPAEMEVNVELINVLGQIRNIKTTQVLSSGENHLEINLDNIETGTYLYMVYSADRVLRGRISIIR